MRGAHNLRARWSWLGRTAVERDTLRVVDERERRRAARAHWPIEKARLGEESSANPPLETTTASERMAMVWHLTLDAWAMSGRPVPAYTRADMPGRMVRGRGTT